MVAAARAVAAAAAVALLGPLLGPLPALTLASLDAAADYGIPIEIKLWDTGRTPLSHMVDVTNEFGLKVLAEHNFLNENNIAFSPYGLMGILVALYEGIDGESSYQIQRGLQLPWNRNVMRIGFRDIHRTLKTYFIPEEGFLAGLALNNENVTFNESYKKILRFYGFDLDGDQLPSFPAMNNTAESSTPSREDGTMVGMAPESTESSVGREETSPASTREETTTTNTNAETFSDIDVRMPNAKPTTANPSTSSNTESTTVPTTNKLTTSAGTTVESVRSTLPLVETATVEIATEALQSTITEVTTLSSFPSSSVEATTSNLLLTSANATVNEIVTSATSSRVSTTDEFSAENFRTEEITRDSPDTSASPSTTPVAETEPTEQPSTAPDATFTADNSSPGNDQSTVKPLQRRKKSIVNFIFKSPPFINEEELMYRAFEIPPLSNTQNVGGDKMFLANGLKNVQVSYMQYEAVLEHAFLPHLEAAALRLPLDSARYYLLALLPARAAPAALPRLLARLARHSDLRDVYAALRPRRVHALLPSFTVKGHVILTADLQKLGIREVFEPRQHDFSPMTPQPGVYVRSVEQAVSVTIRKYAGAGDERNASRYADRQPVLFSATYPFLYFVMDANIHVALMAGKMADPLNSRIL